MSFHGKIDGSGGRPPTALPIGAISPTMPSVKRKPNLLLITTDQQRGDCLGCEGHPVLETPYLDELAHRGCRFRHAYSSVPSCTPARSAILTGMDQWNHGRLAMSGSDFLEFPATLPGELAKADYQTAGIGKMHFFPQRATYGFHQTILDESSRRFGDFISDYHQWFDRVKKEGYGYRDHSVDWNSWMARPTHLPEHLHPTWWTAEEGIRWTRNRDPSRPFFLWLSFARPHSPYDAPEPYFSMYDGREEIPEPAEGDWSKRFDRRVDDVNAPRSRRSRTETRRARAGYYGNITFIDHQIGRYLYELRHHDRETFENTMVVFTSDHGDMMGDHHHWRKTYAYEGSARVPMIVAPPLAWGKREGRVSEAPVEMRDILPTLLEAAGAEIPESVDGGSMLPLCEGNEEGWREFVQGEHSNCYTHEEGMQYVTDGREKYIWFHHTGREQFFDLQSDPLECKDLSGLPEVADRLEVWRGRLAEINERRGDPRGGNGKLQVVEEALKLSPNYDKWRQAGLRRMERSGIDTAHHTRKS